MKRLGSIARWSFFFFNTQHTNQIIYGYQIVLFSLNLITFIIRIITEIYLKNYIDNLSKIDELNRLFEHEKFIEDLGNKIDNGNRWTSNFINDNDSDEVVLKFNN